MDRESVIYKTRRKIQALAYKIVPHDKLSQFYCKLLLHEKTDLKEPKTFNEKLQWYKLFYCSKNNLIIKCSDKYQVRDYITEKGYGHILTRLFGVWENAKDIDWNRIPNSFVLKCTHGCAYNILCKDKAAFNKEEATKQLNSWLREDFAAFNVELHYGKIKPRRIICEEYLGDIITDYKFFCFNGEPQFFYVSTDLFHDRQAEMGFFNMDGSKIPLIRDDYKDIGNIRIPNCLSEMIEAAKVLSKDFPFVRVDFFLLRENFKFAELTFTPAAAMMPIEPRKYDVEWGKMFNLSAINH